MKKLMAGFLLVAAPMFTGLHANTALSQDHQLSDHDSSILSGAQRAARSSHDGGCYQARDGRDGRDGRNGRDGQDGRDGCCYGGGAFDEIAYFYLRPSDFACDDDRTIPDGASILWDSEVFTIKSSGINVLQSFTFDPNDYLPFNFLTVNDDIVISKSGIYAITYTIYANIDDIESEADSITFELNLNDSPVPGSRFTNSVPYQFDYDYENPGNSSYYTEPVQLVGQVITYIPANSYLELTNVSGWPECENPVDVYLENESGRNGVVASISIQRIADDVE